MPCTTPAMADMYPETRAVLPDIVLYRFSIKASLVAMYDTMQDSVVAHLGRSGYGMIATNVE